MVSSAEQPPKGPSSPSSNAVLAQPAALSWARRDLTLIAVLWGIVALALALLSLAAHSHAEFPGDEGLTVLIQKIQFPPLVHFITFASDANWPAPAGYTALAIIIGLLVARQLSAAIAAVVASFGADLANVLLNSVVARPRPHNVHIHVVANLGLHSFPSGHVTHVVTFYDGRCPAVTLGPLRKCCRSSVPPRGRAVKGCLRARDMKQPRLDLDKRVSVPQD